MIELSHTTFPLLCLGAGCAIGCLASIAVGRFYLSSAPPTPPAVQEAIAADMAARHQLRAILTEYKQLVEERHLFENDPVLLRLSLANLQAFLESIGEPTGFLWAASHSHQHREGG